MLTNTWRKRLDGTSTLLRRGALYVGLGSCSIVAIATIWGWIFNDPIDVAGPARSAVNRTALVGSYAQDCVTRWLTATAAHQQSLHDCWSLRDQMRLPTTPAVIVSSPAVSAVTLVDDTGTAQQWSVVVCVSERPFESATPHTAYYRLPVVFTNYGVRASALPARVNGPGAGADAPLGLPHRVPVGQLDPKDGGNLQTGNPVSATVSGFITSYSDRRRRTRTLRHHRLRAAAHRRLPIRPAHQARGQPRRTRPPRPANGTTLHVLATVNAVTSQFAPLAAGLPDRR